MVFSAFNKCKNSWNNKKTQPVNVLWQILKLKFSQLWFYIKSEWQKKQKYFVKKTFCGVSLDERRKGRTIFPALYVRNRYFQPFLITLWLYCILTARDISCNTYQYLSVRMWLGFWKWKYKCFYCFYYSIYFFFFSDVSPDSPNK